MLIYPRQRISQQLQKKMVLLEPFILFYYYFFLNWRISESFFAWLLHFQQFTKPSKDEPILITAMSIKIIFMVTYFMVQDIV
jgi:hypothetical protein